MKKKLLVGGSTVFLGIILTILALFLNFKYRQYAPSKRPIAGINQSVIFAATPKLLPSYSSARIIPADSRVLLIEKYLRRYNSPMVGHGDVIVAAADEYRIPYNLVPAIAQCESNLGKTIPHNSYNAWGYGVYGNKVMRFSDWEEAIRRVTKGLKVDYFDKGLDSPEEIMRKYTPPSNGSWARCVSQYMSELE